MRDGEEAESQQNSSSEDATRKPSEIPPLEWAVAIFGAGVVIVTLVYLIYLGIDAEQSPPDLRIMVQEYTTVESGHLIVFEVFNAGEQAAAQVVVQGTLRDGDTDIETSETTLDYVPSQSRRSGGLYFSNDPDDYTLDLRALGYQQP